MFKGLGNITNLLKQAQEMGGKMQAANTELRGRRVVGAAGGGMVEVEANGLGEVLNVRIDEQLVAQGDREMLEDLLPAAINQALAKAKEMHVEAMKSMTGDMNLPGLDAALAQFTGTQPGPEDATPENSG